MMLMMARAVECVINCQSNCISEIRKDDALQKNLLLTQLSFNQGYFGSKDGAER